MKGKNIFYGGGFLVNVKDIYVRIIKLNSIKNIFEPEIISVSLALYTETARNSNS